MTADAAYHWQIATRFVRTAEVDLASGDPDSAASRTYYAAYHAVAALFALDGIIFRKHEAIEAAVHRDLVKTGRLPISIGKDYTDLRQLRLRGDYGAGLPVDETAARDAITRARRILEAVRTVCPQLDV